MNLTYLVLTTDTWKIINHSKTCSAIPLDKRNIRAERAAKGEEDVPLQPSLWIVIMFVVSPLKGLPAHTP